MCSSDLGMAAGYLGVDQLMFYIGGLGPIQSSAPANCPSINVAAHEIADGHPDRKTGRCTTLSSAYNFKAVAAFIVHPDAPRVADGWLERVRKFFTDLRASN